MRHGDTCREPSGAPELPEDGAARPGVAHRTLLISHPLREAEVRAVMSYGGQQMRVQASLHRVQPGFKAANCGTKASGEAQHISFIVRNVPQTSQLWFF